MRRAYARWCWCVQTMKGTVALHFEQNYDFLQMPLLVFNLMDTVNASTERGNHAMNSFLLARVLYKIERSICKDIKVL